MKVSQIGLISKKITKLDEQFPVQDMLLQTGQLEQFSSGIISYGHIPFLVKQNIDSIISKVLTKHGCSQISLPLLQPESIWAESGRLSKYIAEGVMLQCKTAKGNYCLAPTAEEAVVAFAKTRLTTYKNLPVTYFQIGAKFRNEIRTRGYLLRGKAFDMFDAYSFGKNKQELDEEYENIKNAYFEIFDELGLKVQPVGADSGSIGGSKSEEFMTVSPIGEDEILVEKETGKAFNCELLEKEDYKRILKDNYGIDASATLEKKRAVELGHIFQLGDKYSKTMNGTFVDENGKQKEYIMGCYGIGVSRTLAMIYENCKIEKNGQFAGIALPKNLAPYPLYIIPKLDDKTKTEFAEKIYNEFIAENVNVLYDDRKDISIGAKIKDSKISGSPFTAVFGNSIDGGIIEVENNATAEKIEFSTKDFVKAFMKFYK